MYKMKICTRRQFMKTPYDFTDGGFGLTDAVFEFIISWIGLQRNPKITPIKNSGILYRQHSFFPGHIKSKHTTFVFHLIKK